MRLGFIAWVAENNKLPDQFQELSQRNRCDNSRGEISNSR